MRIRGVSLVIGFMALLDVTIVNVAIPSIRSVSTAPRWRYIFLVNVPIGLAAMVAVTRMVPKRAPRPAGEPGPGLDLLAAGLLGGSVLCLLRPLVAVEGGRQPPLLLLLGVGPLGWAFVRSTPCSPRWRCWRSRR